ncbi:hypothetical protein D3C84_944480 [compost metagenome]
MGIDPAHEPLLGVAGGRAVVAMVVAMQHQFVAALDPAVEQAPKARMSLQGIVAMKVRHHQPGHRHLAEGVNGFDEGLVVGPGLRCHVVQHQ